MKTKKPARGAIPRAGRVGCWATNQQLLKGRFANHTYSSTIFVCLSTPPAVAGQTSMLHNPLEVAA